MTVPNGPPPRNCSVTEPFGTFCVLPISEAALRARPRAAVAVGVV